MSNKPEIVDFLLRNPYCRHKFLERVFGPDVLSSMMEEAGSRVKTVEVKGSGICYAEKKEPASSLVDLRRLELAREHAERGMGPTAVYASISPGFEADGEYYFRNKWWRIWVDPGGCAPEALGFVRSPPSTYRNDVIDIVLTTDRGRLGSLVHQVQANWMGAQEVLVMHAGSDSYRVARPPWSQSSVKPWKPYSVEDINANIRTRQRGGHKRSLMGEVAKNLDRKDWLILITLGNVPLLTDYELAYLFSDYASSMKSTLNRIKNLEQHGLIAVAKSPIARDQLDHRKVLTSLGLELLAAYWNTTSTNMKLWQPWPQGKNGKDNRPIYKLAWLRMFGEHYRLVRQFCLSLVFGSRCVSNPICDVDARVTTTIGSRLLYRDQIRTNGGSRTGIVLPDGLIKVIISQRGWVDGVAAAESRPVLDNAIWLEVDRGTIPLTRLETKLDGYAKVWPGISYMKPALVWVIDGSPHREARILSMMAERGIYGWTVTRDRLCLPEHDDWWLIHTPASLKPGYRVGLNYEMIGGMAPWRSIWASTEDDGLSPFLGAQPWRSRDLQGSSIMEEVQDV